jgi:hypothetical protein
MTGTSAQLNWKRLLVQLLGGAVVGGAGMATVLLAFDGSGLDSSEPSQMLALVAGVIYALLGLMVGVGVFVPRAGARFLNVADVDDLRDQRAVLGLSSAACLLTGLLFLVLAAVPAGGAGGQVSPEVAAAVAALCLVALVVLGRLVTRRADEMSRQVGLEASSLAMQSAFVLFGGWAALSHLGFADWMRPLALVAGLALLQLLAIFWVAGTRGLMVPVKE